MIEEVGPSMPSIAYLNWKEENLLLSSSKFSRRIFLARIEYSSPEIGGAPRLWNWLIVSISQFQSRFGSPIFGELAHETLVFYYFLMRLIQFCELAPQKLGNQNDFGTDWMSINDWLIDWKWRRKDCDLCASSRKNEKYSVRKIKSEPKKGES